MIYVDKKSPVEVRNQAQGFLVLVTQGLGLGIGAKLFFTHVSMNTSEGVANWYEIWKSPAIMAGVILLAFYALFHEKNNSPGKRIRIRLESHTKKRLLAPLCNQPFQVRGAGRIRTADVGFAIRCLSHLATAPIFYQNCATP